jgi:hypothetical protein
MTGLFYEHVNYIDNQVVTDFFNANGVFVGAIRKP